MINQMAANISAFCGKFPAYGFRRTLRLCSLGCWRRLVLAAQMRRWPECASMLNSFMEQVEEAGVIDESEICR